MAHNSPPNPREQSVAPAASPAASSSAAPMPEVLRHLVRRVLGDNREYQYHMANAAPASALADMVVAAPQLPHQPPDVFARLRWGGLFAFASESARQVIELAEGLRSTGFILEQPPTFLRHGAWGLPIPFLSRKVHYLLARKVQLIPPGQTTERFTYQVQLVPNADPVEPLVVLKEVPSEESVVDRLAKKFPEVDRQTLHRRARKFTERIFPTFLTREAAILKILQEHLPKPYCRRVPRVINLERDDHGLVRKLTMNWLRNGGKPLSQMEFAHQSADLLRVVHDIARVIHLDLRLDNFVITPDGVGFVDFGSAVRDDENLQQNPMVGALFEDLMRTSQIQRMLSQMTRSGHVTSDIIRNSCQKVDKAIDFFYLAVQFNCPHSNPDLADLIQYDPESRDARNLTHLTRQILRPADPAHPAFRSAKDILHGIERIQLRLDRRKHTP